MYNPHEQNESGYEGADWELIMAEAERQKDRETEQYYEDEMEQRDWRCKNV